MIKNPIWKDTIHTFTDDDVRFRLSVNGIVIYEGRSKAKPDENYASINVNKICQNYLNNTLENQNLTGSTSFTVTHSEAYREFELQSYSEQTDLWSTEETYGFLFNFGYEDIDMTSTVTLSDKINTHNNNGMLLPSSAYYTNGTVRTGFLTFNGNSIYCGRYSLLYRNAYGGWDNFLFEGKCRKEDDYEISKMKKAYNNTANQFGDTRYINEIKTKWELNTGYLSDSESAKFAKHLLSSNECYLQDLVEGTIIPVVITDTSAKYKEYMNEGEEPVYYTVNVETSQDKIIL